MMCFKILHMLFMQVDIRGPPKVCVMKFFESYQDMEKSFIPVKTLTLIHIKSSIKFLVTANWDNLGKNMSVPDVTVPDVTFVHLE